MAISLTKTLLGIQYGLYFKTSILFVNSSLVAVTEQGYQSLQHFQNGFFPMIGRNESIVDPSTVSTINNQYPGDLPGSISTVESYLISNVTYYVGGSIVS